LEDKGDIIMATAKYGKGTVFAIVDPWIYNEYIVNDRLSPDFQNGIAAGEFSDWLLKQVSSVSLKK
jgi:unsaturated rhamnogalacturonyl hydrolase